MFERSEGQMHRLEGNQNQWEGVPYEDLGFWQKAAKHTRGIINGANQITMLGAAAFSYGLAEVIQGNKTAGLIGIAAARLADVADGAFAAWAKVKSKLGRDLDPIVDAAELLVGLPVLAHAGVIPLIPAIVTVAPKIVDTVGSIAARARGIEMNPSSEGKVSTFGIWGGIGSFAVRAAFGRHTPETADTILSAVGWIGTLGGSALHLVATKEYVQTGFGPVPEATAE